MIEQLYVAPAWIGRGLGRRLVELAKERRPAGLDLYCFAVNAGPARFYERMGFAAVAVRRRQPATRSGSRTSATRGARPRDDVPSSPRPSRTVALRGRHADRRVPVRDRAAAGARPRRGRRPHDVPGPRAAAGATLHARGHRPARPRRVGRHPAVRHRARVRGRRRRRLGAGARRRRPRRRLRALVRRPMRPRRGAAHRRHRAGDLVRGRPDPARASATATRPWPRSSPPSPTRAGTRRSSRRS